MEDNSLVSIGENIWIIEGDIVSFYGFPYPTRSVVIRLQNGTVWIWSPVKLTNHVRQEVTAIGPPMHLVSPNKLHHLYLENWQKEFPHARLWGPASTVRKRPDLSFEPALVHDPPCHWADQIDQCWVRGSFMMDEIVFFHRRSRTVILADLSENFSNKWLFEHWRPWQRWLAHVSGITEGKGYAPHDWRSTFLRRKVLRVAREKMLSWDPSMVVMAHGECQFRNGREYLVRAFEWME
ncbi:DUF4336 domain-containing protein [Bradyrhizobium monzae]|uniref:DUF4336 domain-containing protein n=1 Tax=Bradyrhizobium sp. Oc8 TaxID=2876780 RepID=UPI001F489032|nr:DUF4336 domain-containing protein [Bradyrhizobium sp. Oc8]